MKEGKYLWTTKVNDKGQIVIPNEARKLFNIRGGDTLLILGDKERGLAILKYDDFVDFANGVFNAKGENND